VNVHAASVHLLLTVLHFGLVAVCSEAADKLCRDASHLVKVPALASLGQLLPLLPAADAAAAKPPLLALFASTAKPPAAIAGEYHVITVCSAGGLKQRLRENTLLAAYKVVTKCWRCSSPSHYRFIRGES
jgi:hypothetical protein